VARPILYGRDYVVVERGKAPDKSWLWESARNLSFESEIGTPGCYTRRARGSRSVISGALPMPIGRQRGGRNGNGNGSGNGSGNDEGGRGLWNRRGEG
jgi:hypothetical protein